MKKNLDSKGRLRNVTVSFRVSSEENADLNRRVKLSGLTKQDYIIKRLSERDVIVQGSPRVYKALKEHMDKILIELRRIESGSELSNELTETMQLTFQIYSAMKTE